MSHFSDIKPGQIIGRYEILTPIAQGGMAAVWAARQRGSRGFSKVVAIKTMLPGLSDDPRFEKMFLDEARVASRIRHDNVVEIFDLGEENEILYLVMQWVHGESLSALRRRCAEPHAVPMRVALRIIADVCAGLHAAHELLDDEGQPLGLVHRDISPQNILVGYDGHVKIVDFGVAKIAGRSADTTNVGLARGKPPYMAPEQALGKDVDRRVDIFALGIILYQLLTGRHPFRGENDIATLHNIISDSPVIPPREYVSQIPARVEAIVLRALERDPALRFQTAYDFELALEVVFDSDIGRVRIAEIASLMAERFGADDHRRQNLIREAIRRADSADATVADFELARLAADRPSRARADSGPSLPAPGPSGLALASVVSSDPVCELVAGTAAEASAQKPDSKSPVRVSRVQVERLRWLQLSLAMGVGAIIVASLAVAFSAKPRTQRRFDPMIVVSTSSGAPVGAVTRPPAPADAAVLAVDSSSSAAVPPARSIPRRAGAGGAKSAAGGAVNREAWLPPVPSPGF